MLPENNCQLTFSAQLCFNHKGKTKTFGKTNVEIIMKRSLRKKLPKVVIKKRENEPKKENSRDTRRNV